MVEYKGENFQLLDFTENAFDEESLESIMGRLLCGDFLSPRHPHRPTGLMYLGSGNRGDQWIDLWRCQDQLAEHLPLRAVKALPPILLVSRDASLGIELQWAVDQGDPPRVTAVYRGEELKNLREKSTFWVEVNSDLAEELSREKSSTITRLSPFLWVELTMVLLSVMNRN